MEAGAQKADPDRASTLLHPPSGLVVQEEERGEASPVGPKDPGDLRDVVVPVGRKQVCEHRGQQDEVERLIVERKAVFAGGDAALGVVVPVVEVSDLEMEVRIARRDRLLTPLDATLYDVDPFIPAMQPAGEAHGDPPHAASDVEDVLVGTETGQIHEELPELHSGGAKITAPDKGQTVGRRQWIASTAECRVAAVQGYRAHVRLRAYEANVLQFAAELSRYRRRRTRLLSTTVRVRPGHRPAARASA